ncbi:MAG: molybdate ABC transporter substrate-binding protein [Acidobacteriota bacterium]
MRTSSGARPTRFLVASLAILGLVAVSCGSDDAANDQPSATDAPDTAESAASGEVVVFAAASLTGAFTELGDAFMAANPEASVTFNFAASSELVAQIVEGAPADVFASADLNNMTKLTDADASAGEPVVIANNLSEIIVAPGNPLGITGVEDLANDDLILVVCAPEVPCGTYATQIFENAGVTVNPDSFEENVNAVVTKVALGEADAGIAYATDVTAAGDDADGVEIPAELNVVAEYPIAVTAEAPNPDGGQAFVDFVVSADGQEILASYGFSSP